MSWERMFDRTEKAVCACGEGFVTRNCYEEGDDWDRYRTGLENEIIECEKCSSEYHIEHLMKHYNCPKWVGDGVVDTAYLVPNGHTLQMQIEPERLPFECSVNFEKTAVALFKKEDLLVAIDDMKKSKYSTRLSLEISQRLVSLYHKTKKSKKLSNVVAAIEICINNYDSYEWTFDKVQKFREEETVKLKKNCEELQQILSSSIELKFKDAR